MKVSELLRLLEKDDWFTVRQRGSHRQMHHNTKPGAVTVAEKRAWMCLPGTLNSAFEQAGLKE